MLKQEEIKFEHLKPTSTDEQSLTQTFFLTPLKAIAFLRIYKITNYKFLLSSKHEIHFFWNTKMFVYREN